jgi:flagellar biosynthesis protein FlhA
MIEPDQLTMALDALRRISVTASRDGQMVALVTPPALRVGIRRLIEPSLPRLPVVSLAELPAQTPIQTVQIWELHDAA